MSRYLAFATGCVIALALLYCAARYLTMEDDCAKLGGVVIQRIHTKHCFIVGQR